VERLEQHLGVGRGEEPVPGGLELGTQLAVVVDQPVEHGREPQLGIDHRLRAPLGKIQDLEPPVPERDGARRVHPRPVRAAAVHLGGDPRDRGNVRLGAVEPDLAGDSAHGRPPLVVGRVDDAAGHRRKPRRVSNSCRHSMV
jgi:hypothetical protein